MKKQTALPIIDVKKYGGKQVAIVNGRIAAVGQNLEEVVKKVRISMPKLPLGEIRIFAVPKTLSAIYHA